MFVALCFVVFSMPAVSAGPIRDWVRDNRPGIVIPKSAVVVRPVVPATYSCQPIGQTVVHGTAYQIQGSQCQNGNCQLTFTKR